jgi:hypothetical protein
VSNGDWREVYREERRRPAYVIDNGRPDRAGGCRAARLWLHIPAGDPNGAVRAPTLPWADSRTRAR